MLLRLLSLPSVDIPLPNLYLFFFGLAVNVWLHAIFSLFIISIVMTTRGRAVNDRLDTEQIT